MPLYEQLEKLEEEYHLEQCKGRTGIGRWFIALFFVVLLVLAPLKLGFLTLLVGMAGGLTFELDEKLAKPDAFERLVQENEDLKKELKTIKGSRLFRFKKSFGQIEVGRR